VTVVFGAGQLDASRIQVARFVFSACSHFLGAHPPHRSKLAGYFTCLQRGPTRLIIYTNYKDTHEHLLCISTNATLMIKGSSVHILVHICLSFMGCWTISFHLWVRVCVHVCECVCI
jgi:hypothetical protein